MIAVAVAMSMYPDDGYMFIIALISIYFTVKGIGTLYYYFTMARFMVGGRSSLYTGIIMFDLGMLTGSLTDVPHYYILVYLIALHAFNGAVEILRVQEARRSGATSWKLKMTHGIVDIIMALICVIFLKRLNVAVIVYSTGLVYSAIMRIASACRRTKFIYIQ